MGVWVGAHLILLTKVGDGDTVLYLTVIYLTLLSLILAVTFLATYLERCASMEFVSADLLALVRICKLGDIVMLKGVNANVQLIWPLVKKMKHAMMALACFALVEILVVLRTINVTQEKVIVTQM